MSESRRPVYVVHVPSARNVGDALSNPLRHFPVDHKVVSIGKPEAVAAIPSGSLVIYGGGGLIGEKPAWDAVLTSISERSDIRKIVWGAGFNRSLRGAGVKPIPDQYYDIFSRFDLVGVRDVVPALNWVPCASCMSPDFDAPNECSETISVFLHGDRLSKVPPEIENMMSTVPVMDNFSGANSFPAVVSFIKKSKFVVTNSFHGMYWTFMCGRIPVVFDAFSEKFFLGKWKPLVWSTREALMDKDHGFLDLSSCLVDSRQANQSFYEQFLNIVKD